MSKPFILLRLDKDYELRFDNRAGCTFEQITGKKMTELSDISLTDMNALIYAGIKKKNPNLTLDDVIDLIDEHADIEAISKLISKAFEESTFFKIAKDEKESQKN